MTENKPILSKMTTVQKVLAVMVLILGSLSALIIGGRELVKEIKTTIREVAQENSEERIQEIKELGFLTTDQFMEVSDSIIAELHVNRTVNDTLHKRSFLNQKQLSRQIESAKYSDSTVQRRIDELQAALDELRGIATLTQKEQAEQAYTDSLISANILLKQRELDRQRRRADEIEFDRINRTIRDLSKDIVIDKGRRKTIRVKPKGAKQGPVTR